MVNLFTEQVVCAGRCQFETLQRCQPSWQVFPRFVSSYNSDEGFFLPCFKLSQNSENRLLLALFCVSVRVERLGFRWTDIHEVLYLEIFRKSVEEIQVSLKSDKSNGTSHADRYMYCTVTVLHMKTDICTVQ